MSSIQFLSKAEYRDMVKGGVVFPKYSTKFNCNSKLSKLGLLSFLQDCKKSLGITTKEFNKLYMVESNSKKILNTFMYILNDIGYAIEPIKLGSNSMFPDKSLVYTK